MSSMEDRNQVILTVKNLVYNLLDIVSDVMSVPDVAYHHTVLGKFGGIQRYLNTEIERLQNEKEVFDGSAESAN